MIAYGEIEMAKKKKTISERLTVPHSFQIPMVKNVAELAKMKAAPRKPLLIHFTADQWKQASKGIRQGKGIPKKGFRFVGIPDPDGLAGMDLYKFTLGVQSPCTTVHNDA